MPVFIYNMIENLSRESGLICKFIHVCHDGIIKFFIALIPLKGIQELIETTHSVNI